MQAELFNLGTSGTITDTSSRPVQPPVVTWLDRFRITLRLEHLCIAAILALVLYVLIFSFGVEKGKRIALREQEVQKLRQQEVSKGPSLTPELGLDVRIPQASHLFINKLVTTTLSAVATDIPPVVPLVETISSTILGKYTIQAITFNGKVRAEQEVKRLKDKGYQSFIIPGKKTFQVCVEMFESVALAKQKMGELKADGFVPDDAYIRPVKGPVLGL